jgi:hypothetical protein
MLHADYETFGGREGLGLVDVSPANLKALSTLAALAEVRIEQPRKLQDPSALGALPALRHLRYRAGTMTRLGRSRRSASCATTRGWRCSS